MNKVNLRITILTFVLIFLIYIYNGILPFKMNIVIFLTISIIITIIIFINFKSLNKNVKNTRNDESLKMSFLEQLKRSISIFILKLIILLIIFYFFVIILLNSVSNKLQSLNNTDKPILEKIYEEIVDAADPSHEIDPSKQEKLKKSLRVLANRIKPFIDEINSGLSDEDKENSSD
mgnify:CR=1 FL=1